MKRAHLSIAVCFLFALPLEAQQASHLSPTQRAKQELIRKYKQQEHAAWLKCPQDMSKWYDVILGEVLGSPGVHLNDEGTYPTESDIQKKQRGFSLVKVSSEASDCELQAYFAHNDKVFTDSYVLDGLLASIRFSTFRSIVNKPLARISKENKPIPIQISAEDISGKDAYQYAAAEVIQTQFGSWFEVDPNAKLVLHIGGTNATDSPVGTIQDLSVHLGVYVAAPLAAGSTTKVVGGMFDMASEGGFVVNYTSQERVHYIKQRVFAVLSDFLSSWEGASGSE